MCVHARMHVGMHVRVCGVFVHACMHVYVYACVHTCVCMYMYVCIYGHLASYYCSDACLIIIVDRCLLSIIIIQ